MGGRGSDIAKEDGQPAAVDEKAPDLRSDSNKKQDQGFPTLFTPEGPSGHLHCRHMNELVSQIPINT